MGKQTLPRSIAALSDSFVGGSEHDRADVLAIYESLPKRVLWDTLWEVLAGRYDETNPSVFVDALYRHASKHL